MSAARDLLAQLERRQPPDVDAPAPPLLPCPHCGAEAVLTSPAIALDYVAQIGCTSCKAVVYGYGEEDAATAWNRRHPGDAFRSGAMTLNEARAAQGLPPETEHAVLLAVDAPRKPLDVEGLRKSLGKFFATLPAPPAGFEPAPLTEPTEVEESVSPSLAEVQALAERCKAGDLDAFEEYADAARTLLDSFGPVTAEEIAERRRLWEEIIKLNESILDARDGEDGWICTQAFFRASRHLDLRNLAATNEQAAEIYGLCGDEPFAFEEVHLILVDRCSACALTEPQIARLLAAGAKPC